MTDQIHSGTDERLHRHSREHVRTRLALDAIMADMGLAAITDEQVDAVVAAESASLSQGSRRSPANVEL